MAFHIDTWWPIVTAAHGDDLEGFSDRFTLTHAIAECGRQRDRNRAAIADLAPHVSIESAAEMIGELEAEIDLYAKVQAVCCERLRRLRHGAAQ